MKIPDAVFPESAQVEVWIGASRERLFLESEDGRGKATIALDVEGAQALAQELIKFLRAQAPVMELEG